MTRQSYDQILKDISENQNITHKNSRGRRKNNAAIYEQKPLGQRYELKLAKDTQHMNKNTILHLQNQKRVNGKYRLIDCRARDKVSIERESYEVVNALLLKV